MRLDGRVPKEESTVHQALEPFPRVLVNTTVLSGYWLVLCHSHDKRKSK